jgi:hypothetical protein
MAQEDLSYLERLQPRWTFPNRPEEPVFRLAGRRAEDLLVFDLRVINLKIAADQPPRLVRESADRSSGIILDFQPQHFGEQAFLDATGPEVASIPEGEEFNETAPGVEKNVATAAAEPAGPLPAARIRMAGKSRLAFTMPDDTDSLPLTFEAVLTACQRWAPRLSSLAVAEPMLRPELSWGTAVLTSMATSAGWRAVSEILDATLSDVISPQASTAINAASRRIAGEIESRIGGELTSRELRAIHNAVTGETRALESAHDALNHDVAREITQLAIAIKATEIIAQSKPDHTAVLVDIFDGIKIILKPHQPPDTVTALELPYRLITTHLAKSSWFHSALPVARHDRTELWHTRLETWTAQGKQLPSPIRAIWSPDYPAPDSEIMPLVNNDPPMPFRMSLDALDRKLLVRLMAGFNEKQFSSARNPPAYIPRPAYADRLVLSALGALLDAEGNWDYRKLPVGISLEQWRHLAALGRDQYVRVVYRGYLYPFGHSASLIKVTERKFESHGSGVGQRIAVLRQRFFIVVREFERAFNGAGHQYDGRNFPLSHVRIHTRETPNLRPPEQSEAMEAPGQPLFNEVPNRACFWPMITASDTFNFELSATGIDGAVLSFHMPLLFVGLEINQKGLTAAALAAYQVAPAARRQTDFHGNSLCFAPLPQDPEAQGDPRLPTSTVVFTGAHDSSAGDLDPHIYPEIAQADIGVRALQKMLGDPNAELTVSYPQVYLDGGFVAGNPGELFLTASNPYALAFGEGSAKSDSLGAIATPAMDVAGLSRQIGPAGDPDQVANNDFNPASFFKDAKILGGISVADLLQGIFGLAQAPKMLSKELPDRIEASFDWVTEIHDSDPLGIFIHSPAGETTTFAMHGKVVTPLGQPQASTFASQATLDHFKVNLFGFIIIWFDRLSFISKSGSKADVLVDLRPPSASEGPIEFGGPLEFINQLSDIIPMDGFSDPPNITVSPSGLTASYSLAIPSLQVGIFALTNMSIGAGFTLPFNSEPMAVRFNFSERENPFSLTVSLFGGGGFFALGIGTEGVNEIEAALEFGAAIAIDLGVASGGVEVKGGVYFHWQQDLVQLTGYVRLHGELSVIGLISASLTFNLQLSYLKEGNKSVVWGEASLIIEVEVLVFSGSVEVQCRREFAGSESDPGFLDLVPDQPTWADYCSAFATEEAA